MPAELEDDSLMNDSDESNNVPLDLENTSDDDDTEPEDQDK